MGLITFVSGIEAANDSEVSIYVLYMPYYLMILQTGWLHYCGNNTPLYIPGCVLLDAL